MQPYQSTVVDTSSQWKIDANQGKGLELRLHNDPKWKKNPFAKVQTFF